MNLAKRLDELARKKAEMEAGEESDDDLPQADWPVRQGKVSQPRGPAHPSHPSRATSRQMEQDEGEEEEEEMEENGMDDEREEDELHLSSKQGIYLFTSFFVSCMEDSWVHQICVPIVWAGLETCLWASDVTENLQFALAQDILRLAWVSGRVLISIPAGTDKNLIWTSKSLT